jgi:hypothetical protein
MNNNNPNKRHSAQNSNRNIGVVATTANEMTYKGKNKEINLQISSNLDLQELMLYL